MSDQKPTHLPAEGEGTPALPGETDLKPKPGMLSPTDKPEVEETADSDVPGTLDSRG